MSSFLFLTFCVYVFRCLGLHFQPFLFQIRPSDGFYLCRTNLHRSLTPGQQGWSAASVVSFPYPASKTAHKAAQGRVWFLPRTNLPLPLKGERLDFAQLGGLRVRNAEKPGAFPKEKTDTSYPRASLGSCLWQLMLTTAPTASTGLVWCLVGVVSPIPAQKSHAGHTGPSFGFCSLAGTSQREYHAPFQNSHVKIQAEEKTTSALLLKIHPG